jgi:hypothetical protein
VQSACARVASKWSSEGYAADAAEDWALDLVGEFAAARGITLTGHEDNPSANTFETAQTEVPDEARPPLTVQEGEVRSFSTANRTGGDHDKSPADTRPVESL